MAIMCILGQITDQNYNLPNTNMTTLYWQVFKNLEREFQELADTIYINDAQQEVYSMKIADLLIRTVIEIEALAKELYLANEGPVLPDEDMYFDTVCMNHLNGLWNLDAKVVQVVSPNVYFDREENKVLRPLHKAHKRGTSSSDWNKAYQAVKHNRVKELSKGSIKHFLHGLAALYLLNIYYKDEQLNNLSEKDKGLVDRSFGSSLFAIKLHSISGLSVDGTYNKQVDYDECTYIIDYEPNSKDRAIDAMKEMNDYINNQALLELERLMREKAANGEIPTQEWVDQMRSQAIKNALPIKDYKLGKRFTDGLNGLLFNAVLNKQQY